MSAWLPPETAPKDGTMVRAINGIDDTRYTKAFHQDGYWWWVDEFASEDSFRDFAVGPDIIGWLPIGD